MSTTTLSRWYCSPTGADADGGGGAGGGAGGGGAGAGAVSAPGSNAAVSSISGNCNAGRPGSPTQTISK